MCFLMADFSRINKLKKGKEEKTNKKHRSTQLRDTCNTLYIHIRALIHSRTHSFASPSHSPSLYTHTHRQQDLNTLGTVQIPFGTHTHSCTHPHCHSRSQKKRKKNHAVFCAASINWDGCKCRIVTIITVSRSLSLFGFRFGFSFSLLWFRRFFSIFLLTSLP